MQERWHGTLISWPRLKEEALGSTSNNWQTYTPLCILSEHEILKVHYYFFMIPCFNRLFSINWPTADPHGFLNGGFESKQLNLNPGNPLLNSLTQVRKKFKQEESCFINHAQYHARKRHPPTPSSLWSYLPFWLFSLLGSVSSFSSPGRRIIIFSLSHRYLYVYMCI